MSRDKENSMKLRKKAFALLAALACAVSLAACGGEVVGDDWRVSGIVDADGTITHDGESVDVLVAVSPESAAFYRDEAEQILFDSISFPMAIPDAESAFYAIRFDDLDGDGESDVTVDFRHADGTETHLVWIWDAHVRYVFREELSDVTGGEDPADDALELYVGLWEYVGQNFWLRVYENADWAFLDADENTIMSGTAVADADGIELHDAASGDVLRLIPTDDDELYDSANDGYLHPVEAITPAVPVFEAAGLSVDCTADSGTYLLENGVSNYAGLGDGYTTADCYWEVTKTGDMTHDGIREIEFDAICYIPEDSIPYFGETFITNTNSELYDAYTGMWLTAATAYSTTGRGGNHYLHTVEWNGQSYTIEFFYSTDWQDNVGDWAKVLTKSYIVYLPADYDGLIFAAEAQPDNYRDNARLMQLDSISPEACITDIDLIDPYSSLYFSICD